jgi:hypothetical protein
MSTSDGQSTGEAKEPRTRHVEADDSFPVAAGGVKVVHVDGTADVIDPHAIGGEYEGMPVGYFYSPQFIGTVVVRGPQDPV